MTKTKSLEKAADVAASGRARNPLIWIVTGEEARVERYLVEAAASAGSCTRTWDVAAGCCEIGGSPSPFRENENIRPPRVPVPVLRDPGEMLAFIGERSLGGGDRCFWIMRDLPGWLAGPGATTMRQLRNLARSLPGTPTSRSQTIVVLSPSGDVPPELAGHVTLMDWPLPDREEIAEILDMAIASLPPELQAGAAPNGAREAAVSAALGLSGEEASSAYGRSLVQLKGRIDPAIIVGEKRRIIAREKVLQYYDPIPGGLEALGGLENLKVWLMARAAAWTPEARAYRLPLPKGCLIVGVSGCGKSLTPKAIATYYRRPLLRFDMNAAKSKFLGESEGNLRKVLQVIEAFGPCVIWIDEVEKTMQGATSGSADGGVAADALGTFLTWMQERTSEAFVIATANDIEGLPPEVLRKGRFDEIWWVDLPTETERRAILVAALQANGRQPVSGGTKGIIVDVDLDAVAARCVDFTGAEIAAIVPEAMFAAFGDGGREIETADLLTAAATVIPLATTAADKIKKMREWAKGKARPASITAAPETMRTRQEGRVLDVA